MRYEIYEQLTIWGRRFAWRLKAGNGEKLAYGESYTDKADAWNAVNLVRASANCRVDDLTTKKGK